MADDELTPQQLREIYGTGTLKQRYHIACQRIDLPDLGPSVLVNAVSALEGFSRAVAVHALVQAGMSLRDAYAYHRNTGTVDLISKHICPWLRTTPTRAFGASAWKQIPSAVLFRNLLIHEATFLNGGTCKRLIAASRHCLDKLAALTSAA
ncbi:MAG: hypothetical protein R2910_02465 [Gemmatimonadales bacterium]